MPYKIFADTACDISIDLLKKWDVSPIALNFSFESDAKKYTDYPITDFYHEMRTGKVAKTSAINTGEFIAAFEDTLAAGIDVFYLAFSSGLSSTYMNAVNAAEELAEKYPERRVTVVDSLAASAGYGLLLYLCVKMRDDGADADALKAFAEDIRLKICHWFTVDDLVYLKRGGRVSAATALAGAVLGIKPILHVDDEGHLINMAKIRGRKASVRAIAKKFGELYDPSAKEKTPFSDTIFISHADCPADAKELESILSEEYGFRTELITDIGPVIGAHSGPGTLALFFVGKSR